MGDLLKSFPGGAWEKTKHAEKACGALSGQSTILKAIIGNCVRPRRGVGALQWVSKYDWILVVKEVCIKGVQIMSICFKQVHKNLPKQMESACLGLCGIAVLTLYVIAK